MRYFLIPALLGLAGVLTAAETAQAQVRIVVGVGGRGPAYYPRGYGYSPYYAPRYAYPPPLVVGVGPVVVPRDTYYAPQLPTAEPLSAPPVQSNVARIRVIVPDPQAKVWFDGSLTSQTGTDRLYHTPSLAPGGTYSYRIRASWTQNGEPMIQEQVVSVTPGQTSVADFARPVSEPK